MSYDDDVEYFRQRTVQERHRAIAAGEGPIARVHLDLASRYARRVEEAERRVQSTR